MVFLSDRIMGDYFLLVFSNFQQWMFSFIYKK